MGVVSKLLIFWVKSKIHCICIIFRWNSSNVNKTNVFLRKSRDCFNKYTVFVYLGGIPVLSNVNKTSVFLRKSRDCFNKYTVFVYRWNSSNVNKTNVFLRKSRDCFKYF